MSHHIGSGTRVILSGGGNEKQSFTLDSFFLQNIPKNGAILYIPIALRGHRLFEGADMWFGSVLVLHRRLDIKVTTLRDFNAEVSLENFDAIYIGGGNTWSLLKEIRETSFDTHIYNYIARDNKIIYGGSAGAILLGKNISCQNDSKIENFTDEKGLSLAQGYSFTCHYKGQQDEDRFINDWVNKQDLEVLALSEDGGIVMKDNSIEKVTGNKHFLFKKTGKSILS